jgi:16S rRNA (cytidine1402-2'-O)-methyltransferase
MGGFIMGELFIVATPIGNLKDITLRGIEVLRDVDEILCEDTRQTHKLLTAHEIATPTRSYHEHSSSEKEARIIERLVAGEKIALVTDAGTPGISDPGARLISLAREATIQVTPIPGPSAATAAVSVSGLDGEHHFVGFLPHKKGRETALKRLRGYEGALVFYEAPTRLCKLLEQLEAILPGRYVQVHRELTKIHEEIRRGLNTEVVQYYKDHPPKGECVVIVEPHP